MKIQPHYSQLRHLIADWQDLLEEAGKPATEVALKKRISRKGYNKTTIVTVTATDWKGRQATETQEWYPTPGEVWELYHNLKAK